MEELNALLRIDLNYILIALMVIFYSLEQVLNTQFKFTKRPQHLLNNLLFQAVFFIGNIFWATVTVYSIQWLNNHHIGLLYYVQVPLWLKLTLGVALFDFVNYWFHRTAHKVPLLWRFHRVHHSDTSMDASTNFRAHPIELILWFGTSNIVAAGIFGLDLVSLGLFFLIATPFFFLEHTNLSFPSWIDKSFGILFTTPNLHKIHHEQDQYYTDSNFSDIFIIWDKLFGTYKYKPVEEIKFGLREFEQDEKQTFWYLMKSPFMNIKRIHSNSVSTNSKVSQPSNLIVKNLSGKV
jgi:sterol desaturase/sphingolipid hydroxylase (fatty acid hydroxylase superfamily)